MKKIIFLLSVAMAFFMSSCEKESLGVSQITTYATMTLNGNDVIGWQKGTPFVDPGCTAVEGTTDLTANIVIEDDVDADAFGIYTVNYSVKNSDGFWASTSRTVVVCDMTAPLNGAYTSSLNRKVLSTGATTNRGPFQSIVYGIGNDQYYIDDLIGGWYNFGSGYGWDYAGPGIVKVNTDNTVTLVSAADWVWGPCNITAEGAVVNPATKTWVLHTSGVGVAGYIWTVTLSNPITF